MEAYQASNFPYGSAMWRIQPPLGGYQPCTIGARQLLILLFSISFENHFLTHRYTHYTIHLSSNYISSALSVPSMCTYLSDAKAGIRPTSFSDLLYGVGLRFCRLLDYLRCLLWKNILEEGSKIALGLGEVLKYLSCLL